MNHGADDLDVPHLCMLYNCVLVSTDETNIVVQLGRPALMNGTDDERALREYLEDAGFEVTYVPYVYQPGDPESG